MNMTEISSIVAGILKNEFIFAILLGSACTERFHSESDIDLAIYFKNEIDFERHAQFVHLLSEALKCDVDLVALNKIDPIFARQVLETGRELIVSDRSFYNIWKAQQLSIYPDFKESRAIIEENLLNRKKYV